MLTIIGLRCIDYKISFLKTTKKSNSGDIHYSWSSINRLLNVETDAKTITYRYDGEDRRIGKIIVDGATTTETEYLIDSERNYNEIVLARTRINGGKWSEQLCLYAPDGVGNLITQTGKGAESLY